MIAVLCAGCTAEASIPSFDKTSKSSEISIGVVGPLARFKKETKYIEGINLAVSEINGGKGILGRKIRIVEADDKSVLEKGMQIAQDFADKKEVSAVIGHWNSFISVPAAAIYEKAGIVMLSPGSTSPQLTNMNYGYIFRGTVNDKKLGEIMAKYADKKGYKRTVIYYNDDDYGRGLANAFENTAENTGIKVVDRLTFFGGDQEPADIMNRWKALDFDSIFLATTLKDGVNFIRQVRKYGINAAIIGGDGLSYQQLIEDLGPSAEGIVVPTFYDPDYNSKTLKKFITDFKTKYGHSPDSHAARGYEAVKLLAYAIKKGGSSSPKAIADVLHKTKNWSGITGSLTYDDTGEVSGMNIFKQIVKNDKFEYLP